MLDISTLTKTHLMVKKHEGVFVVCKGEVLPVLLEGIVRVSQRSRVWKP